jgi:hypothetical protein
LSSSSSFSSSSSSNPLGNDENREGERKTGEQREGEGKEGKGKKCEGKQGEHMWVTGLTLIKPFRVYAVMYTEYVPLSSYHIYSSHISCGTSFVTMM